MNFTFIFLCNIFINFYAPNDFHYLSKGLVLLLSDACRCVVVLQLLDHCAHRHENSEMMENSSSLLKM